MKNLFRPNLKKKKKTTLSHKILYEDVTHSYIQIQPFDVSNLYASYSIYSFKVNVYKIEPLWQEKFLLRGRKRGKN